MEAGRTPTAWPISQIAQRASSFSSSEPNTACRTNGSSASLASARSSTTVRRPSCTVTAPPRSCFSETTCDAIEASKRSGPWKFSGDQKSSHSDPATGVGLRELVPLGACRVAPRPTEEGVRELLAELDARLVERVDVVQRAGVGGRQLEQEDQPAHVPRV